MCNLFFSSPLRFGLAAGMGKLRQAGCGALGEQLSHPAEISHRPRPRARFSRREAGNSLYFKPPSAARTRLLVVTKGLGSRGGRRTWGVRPCTHETPLPGCPAGPPKAAGNRTSGPQPLAPHPTQSLGCKFLSSSSSFSSSFLVSPTIPGDPGISGWPLLESLSPHFQPSRIGKGRETVAGANGAQPPPRRCNLGVPPLQVSNVSECSQELSKSLLAALVLTRSCRFHVALAGICQPRKTILVGSRRCHRAATTCQALQSARPVRPAGGVIINIPILQMSRSTSSRLPRLLPGLGLQPPGVLGAGWEYKGARRSVRWFWLGRDGGVGEKAKGQPLSTCPSV